MVGFNPTSAFSMPQASRFSSPRKASSAEDDFQPINTPTEEPEESAESEPAVQTSKKHYAPLPQHFTPPAKPSGHNWLAYAGIGTVTTGMGALAGAGYKTFYLPHSKIELKEGWIKNTKTPKDVKANTAWLHSDNGNNFLSNLEMDKTSPLWQSFLLDKQDLKNEAGQKIKEVALQGLDKSFKGFQYYEIYEGSTEGIQRELIFPNNMLNDSPANKMLVISSKEADKSYAYITSLNGTTKDIKNETLQTITAIKPPSVGKVEGEWRSELASLWSDLTKENKTVDELHAALEAKGYTIEKNFAYGKTKPIIPADAFYYKSWDDVAKAAVKNEKDWWKLVPKEGMGKFVGGGALAGLAVAGAGIGLYEALKPKPIQPSPLNRQG
jgi:hypothetical protein